MQLHSSDRKCLQNKSVRETSDSPVLVKEENLANDETLISFALKFLTLIQILLNISIFTIIYIIPVIDTNNILFQ